MQGRQQESASHHMHCQKRKSSSCYGTFLSLATTNNGERIQCPKCDKIVKTLKNCESDMCQKLICMACYPNATEIGPKVCSKDCGQEVRNTHEQGEQFLEIAMTKMLISKTVSKQSQSIVNEYGRNEPPVGKAPRMIQLTTPKGKRTDFNAKERTSEEKST